MKRIFIWILCLLLLTGCGSVNTPDGGKLQVVTTVFPAYDWVRQIAGDTVDVTLLADNGVDLHSYQPTAADMVNIVTCDMLIYVGGESDAWVADALQEADKDIVIINLLETLGDGVKQEEILPGMQTHDDESAPDEHVWLSLKNANLLCRYIADKLCEIDAANKDRYTANVNAYVEKLHALDQKYQTAVDAAPVKTLLFADRFPFRYMADDYGLAYHAAFPGCSAETEASFATIVFLAGKVDELNLPAVLQIEGTDGAIARTVRDNTAAKNQKILTMDSLQSVTAKDIKNGATYLGAMEKNLAVLKEALTP